MAAGCPASRSSHASVLGLAVRPDCALPPSPQDRGTLLPSPRAPAVPDCAHARSRRWQLRLDASDSGSPQIVGQHLHAPGIATITLVPRDGTGDAITMPREMARAQSDMLAAMLEGVCARAQFDSAAPAELAPAAAHAAPLSLAARAKGNASLP